MQATDFNSWTTEEDVCNWLDYVNLGQYQIAFRRAEIEGRHLSYVDNNFLITQLHTTSMIQQQELKRAVESLIGSPAQSSALFTSRRRVVMDGKCEPLLNNSAQALLHDKCRHSGWLKKLGAKVKNWKQRYHVLINGCLYYFKQDTSPRAKGHVERATEVRQFPWAYKLVNKEQSKRTWFFATSAQQEMETWMQKIAEDIVEFCEPATSKRPRQR